MSRKVSESGIKLLDKCYRDISSMSNYLEKIAGDTGYGTAQRIFASYGEDAFYCFNGFKKNQEILKNLLDGSCSREDFILARAKMLENDTDGIITEFGEDYNEVNNIVRDRVYMTSNYQLSQIMSGIDKFQYGNAGFKNFMRM